MSLLASEVLRVRSRRVAWRVPAAVVGLVAVGVVAASAQGATFDVAGRAVPALADLAPYAAWLFALVGASLLGAGQVDGSLTRALSVEPRRHRVVLTGLVVAALAAALGALVATVAALAVLLVAAAVGPFAGAPAEVLGVDLLIAVATTSAGAAVAAVLGGAAAIVGRSTVAGITACSVLLVLIEPVVGALVEPLAGRGPFVALLGAMGGPDSAAGSVVGASAGWPTALAWAVAASLLAAAVLTRRDVVDGV